jgi:hypothetical protein
MTLPKARTERLTVSELADETLVYDHDRQRAHCLNATAALVWRHCDGQTSVEQLAALLPQGEGAEAVVRLALDQLSRRGLLVEKVAPLTGQARVSRREALKKLVVAAVALPAVMTIVAPKAWAGFSQLPTSCQGLNNGAACFNGASASTCCGGTCISSTTDFTSDNNNCGSCGNKCPSGQTCQSGSCGAPVVTSCAGVADGTSCGSMFSGSVCCGGQCISAINFGTDINNCGRCGNRCTGGQTCQIGKCACPPGSCVPGTPCPAGFTCSAPPGQLCGTCPI